MKQEILITLNESINGYWDGGKKDKFNFSIDEPEQDADGFYCKVGSWDANFFFHIGTGKTKIQSDKQIIATAIKVLKHKMRNAEIQNIEVV